MLWKTTESILPEATMPTKNIKQALKAISQDTHTHTHLKPAIANTYY